MQFEEAELGLKQSGGVHGKGTGRGEEDEDKAPKGNSRHVRESLPPTWASNSLDSGPPKISPPGHDVIESEIPDARGRQRMGDEREVRKNGYYMHHRR